MASGNKIPVEPVPPGSWMLILSVVNFTMFGVWFSLAIPAVLAIKRRAALSMRVFVGYFVYLLCIFGLYCAFIVATALPTVHVLHREPMSYFQFVKHKSLWFWMVACNGILSDALFTYQCWIICNRSRWIAIPLVLHISSRACVIGSNTLLTVQHDYSAALWYLAIAGIVLELAAHGVLLAASLARLVRLRRDARAIGTGAHYIRLAKLLAASEFVYAALSISPLFTMNELIYIVRFASTQIFPLFILINAGRPTRVDSCVGSECIMRMTLDASALESKASDAATVALEEKPSRDIESCTYTIERRDS